MLDFMAQQSLQVYMLSQEIRFKDLQTAMDNVKDHDFRPSFATIGNLLKNEYHVFEKFERWNFSKKKFFLNLYISVNVYPRNLMIIPLLGLRVTCSATLSRFSLMVLSLAQWRTARVPQGSILGHLLYICFTMTCQKESMITLPPARLYSMVTVNPVEVFVVLLTIQLIQQVRKIQKLSKRL